MSTLKFCRDCNNILYPTEDKDYRRLLWACPFCGYKEIADNNWVYRVELNRPSADKSGTDPTTDPTLPRTKNVKCANCSYGEAVFYEAPAKGEQGMALYFACCRPQCGHRWRD